MFTIFIIFIFLLGHNFILPIGNMRTSSSSDSHQFIETINAVTGGNFSSLSIFALGISPWMSTLILWQLIRGFDDLAINKLPNKILYRLQMVVMIIIAAIQGAALLYLQFENLTNQLPKWQVFSLLLILITGSVFVVWLGNLNTQYGLGGSMIIVIIGIVLNSTRILIKLPWDKIITLRHVPYLLLAILIIYIYIWQIIAMSQAEYQIPIRRILIQQEYKQETTLPIPLLPSSGMQFMYAMMLFNLFTIFINVIHQHWEHLGWLSYINENLTFNSKIGFALYLLVIAVLCFGFSNLNFNTEDISKTLQKSGDYILHIMPGKQTKKYLDNILFRITLVEIIYSWMMTGLPLIYTMFYPKYQKYALSVTMLFILISMSLKIIQEIRFILQYDANPSIIEYVQSNK